MKALQHVALLFCSLTISCGSIVIDDSVNAAEANDTTVILQGCGNQPISGFTYCRRTEGPITDQDVIYVHIPESNCDRESCVEIQVFAPGGTQIPPIFVPRDRRLQPMHWAELVGRNEFNRGDKGLWTIGMIIYWKDNEGLERRTAMAGEIRLRVLADGYTSLHQSRGEGPYAFRWDVEGPYRLGYTTSGRSSVWRR